MSNIRFSRKRCSTVKSLSLNKIDGMMQCRRLYCALPVLGYPQFRSLLEYSGVKCYADAPCTVYADSRFTACFPHDPAADFTFETSPSE